MKYKLGDNFFEMLTPNEMIGFIVIVLILITIGFILDYFGILKGPDSWDGWFK